MFVLNAIYMGCARVDESGREWFLNLSSALLSFGYVSLPSDPCCFILHKDGCHSIIGLHVDDIIHVTNSSTLREDLLRSLSQHYGNLTIHRDCDQFLGVNIVRSSTVHLHQNAFIQDLLTREDVTITHADTPSRSDFFITSHSPLLDVSARSVFVSVTMSLMYLALNTRPDILKEVTFLSSRCSCATVLDFTKLERVLSYLHDHAISTIYFRSRAADEPWTIDAYSDASHLMYGDTTGNTGIMIFLDLPSSPIVSAARKQRLVTRSTAEAELLAMDDTCTYLVWLKNLLVDLGLLSANYCPILHTDNSAAIQLLQNGIGFKRCKHFLNKYYFIRQCIADGSVTVKFCPTADMRADLYTKTFPVPRFNFLRRFVIS